MVRCSRKFDDRVEDINFLSQGWGKQTHQGNGRGLITVMSPLPYMAQGQSWMHMTCFLK